MWKHFSNKLREHDIKMIETLGEEMVADPEKFVDTYNLRCKIPIESLPCVVNMTANGDVKYYNRLQNANNTKHITLTFPLKENYKVASFRAGRRTVGIF